MERSLRVLVLGDQSHRDFRAVKETLERDAQILTAADSDQPVELVLLFQATPSTGDADRLKQLRQQRPLSGLAVVLGTWCEGETRTGRPLPHAERLFWYQFAAWWHQVLEAWTLGKPTHWQYVGNQHRLHDEQFAGQRIAVDAPDFESAHAIIESIEQLGGQGIWQSRWKSARVDSEVTAGIWIGAQLNEIEEKQLASFRVTLPEAAPLIVLLDFPRHDRVQRARELGASDVLGKPWRMDQLAAIVDLAQRRESRLLTRR